MNKFHNKKVFIAPFSPLSKAFQEYLITNTQVLFKGFIDKLKDGDNIYKIGDIVDDTFDYIIIFSPNHEIYIYEEYTKFIEKEKIILVYIQNNTYKIKNSPSLNLKNKIEYYSNLIDTNNEQRSGIAFISKGFIDANNKYLYLACLSNKIKSTIITTNQEQLKTLQTENLPCELLESENSYKIIAEAKYIVFDQANYTYFYISKHQITIQLWHGVGLKKMSKSENITYDYFISTSHWTNNTNFKHIFLAKEYLNIGYPRNDFLIQKSNKYDTLFCDDELLQISKDFKTILYMPTLREYLFKTETTISLKDILPLDLELLNTNLQILNTIFILKLHPYVLEFFKDLIVECNFTHVKFHPAQGDIYPILKHTDILVTDYSSVAYDFLLLDRPIIFFDYDREKYEQNMDGFLFDYDEYSPGIKVKTQKELIEAIQSEDRYKEDRLKMKEMFFDTQNISASEYIIQNILKKEI